MESQHYTRNIELMYLRLLKRNLFNVFKLNFIVGFLSFSYNLSYLYLDYLLN